MRKVQALALLIGYWLTLGMSATIEAGCLDQLSFSENKTLIAPLTDDRKSELEKRLGLNQWWSYLIGTNLIISAAEITGDKVLVYATRRAGLIAGTEELGDVSVWDSQTKKLIRRFSSWDRNSKFSLKGAVKGSIVSPDGNIWALRQDNRLFFFDLESGEIIRKAELKINQVVGARWISRGLTQGSMVSSDGNAWVIRQDNNLVFFDIKDREITGVVAIEEDPQEVVVADTNQMKSYPSLLPSSLSLLGFSPDSKIFAYSHSDNGVRSRGIGRMGGAPRWKLELKGVNGGATYPTIVTTSRITGLYFPKNYPGLAVLRTESGFAYVADLNAALKGYPYVLTPLPGTGEVGPSDIDVTSGELFIKGEFWQVSQFCHKYNFDIGFANEMRKSGRMVRTVDIQFKLSTEEILPIVTAEVYRSVAKKDIVFEVLSQSDFTIIARINGAAFDALTGSRLDDVIKWIAPTKDSH